MINQSIGLQLRNKIWNVFWKKSVREFLRNQAFLILMKWFQLFLQILIIDFLQELRHSRNSLKLACMFHYMNLLTDYFMDSFKYFPLVQISLSEGSLETCPVEFINFIKYSKSIFSNTFHFWICLTNKLKQTIESEIKTFCSFVNSWKQFIFSRS